MNEASLIELHGIAKTYGRGDAVFHALRGVDLQINRGEFVAIMGPSGSGKSTLMNLLGCLDTPTAGSYRFNGIAIESLSKDQRSLIRRHALGFVFQGFNLLARTSALENVELPLLYRGVPARQRREMAHEALTSVGMANKEKNTPAELSGGQQQRVAIARAIVTAPETLFADEPTGNLDSKTTVEIMELLCKLNNERGKASRVWFLRDGAPVECPVKVGITDGRVTEVTGEGLREALPVIISAAPPAKP